MYGFVKIAAFNVKRAKFCAFGYCYYANNCYLCTSKCCVSGNLCPIFVPIDAKLFTNIINFFYTMGCFLTNSSVGKKVVMSLSGFALVFFILFHMSMNLTMLFSPEAYNMICEMLGANWYALVATVGLAVLVVIHFVYAIILTINNYRARGNQRYAVTVQEKGVAWSSKNMLVLGVVVLLGLGMHLVHFWSEMQLQEILGNHTTEVGNEFVSPTNGAAIMLITFSKWYWLVLYLVWFVALWFHLTHGVWSMFQSLGFANDTWYPRLKCISNIVATLIFLGFAVVAVYCFVQAQDPANILALTNPVGVDGIAPIEVYAN